MNIGDMALKGSIRTGSGTVYLATNWLDQTNTDERPVATSADLTVANNAGYYSSWVSSSYCWPTYYTKYEKIRLTLSDVEHLRKCAREDKKLKAALQKIAPHIEVEVDF